MVNPPRLTVLVGRKLISENGTMGHELTVDSENDRARDVAINSETKW